jgi:hypothetical protein
MIYGIHDELLLLDLDVYWQKDRAHILPLHGLHFGLICGSHVRDKCHTHPVRVTQWLFVLA